MKEFQRLDGEGSQGVNRQKIVHDTRNKEIDRLMDRAG